jgi:exopolysaccharide biosynthesis polyprenyl glycosylphosphotransferase
MSGYLFSISKRGQHGLLFGDILLICVSIVISYAIRIYFNMSEPDFSLLLEKINPWQLIVVITHLFTLYLFDQYNLESIRNKFRSSIMIILSVLAGGILISGVFFFLPKYVFGRQVMILHLGVTSILLILWRTIFLNHIYKNLKPKKLILLGSGQIISSFNEFLAQNGNNEYEISGIYTTNDNVSSASSLNQNATKYQNIREMLGLNNFDILAFDPKDIVLTNDEIYSVIKAKYTGKAIYDLPTLYKNLTGRVPITYIDGRWLLGKEGLQGTISMPYIRLKRFMDIALSAFAIILLFPMVCLISVVIKLEGKGSVFYKQERMGMGKKNFTCYKFRSMRENAEFDSGPIPSTENDDRVTKIGNLLRKTRLDELPQLFNILKGDMSFVGPRPIREFFANKMAEKVPFYWLRYDVKPGVTGWAQVHNCYAVPNGLEALEYELFYIQNMSFLLDLHIILKTLKTVLWASGK